MLKCNLSHPKAMDGKSEERSTPIVWDGPIIAAMPVFNEEETSTPVKQREINSEAMN